MIAIQSDVDQALVDLLDAVDTYDEDEMLAAKEDALKTITSNTAKALGIDSRVGTLEVGKDATLFVSEGDALDYRTNKISHVFISGKTVTLSGNQQELFERYSKKYGQTK